MLVIWKAAMGSAIWRRLSVKRGGPASGPAEQAAGRR
jgi:hypothetical protein